MELENPLITIIIPIYNREQTLERCLCSVLRQTYTHLEIIAVDDGSTDHSRVILDKYQKKDSRLRVVRKKIPVCRKAGTWGCSWPAGNTYSLWMRTTGLHGTLLKSC